MAGRGGEGFPGADDLLWYKDAIIYELHVRAFMDSDGYDIADYTSVHPSYGTVRDVRRLVREAHRRGLRVITELVCNHTSDQHPWFQRARGARRGSNWRD